MDLVANLAFLEPFVCAQLRNKKVRFMCDNLGVVQAIIQQMADSLPVVVLLRYLVVQGLALSAHFTAVHVPGVHNGIADGLYTLCR